MPNSLYLTSAPAFFQGSTWPWVDPTTGTVHALPAQARFAAGTPNIVPNARINRVEKQTTSTRQ
jgi:hypothetical protein